MNVCQCHPQLPAPTHLGFHHELVARFPDGALRRQLPKGAPDRLSIGAVDPCLEVEFQLGRILSPKLRGTMTSIHLRARRTYDLKPKSGKAGHSVQKDF
jgi:hypothetical protein